MKKHLIFLLLAGICAIPNSLFAQLSPSGQMKVITPSIISACASDTIWVELTNKNGPSCVGGSTTVPDAQVMITIPGNGEITYQSGTVGSYPQGATEVSYTGNVLTLDIPVPSFATTTRAWFVLNSTCDVTGVNPLPSLSLTATYPTAMNTPTETWESAKMNTGQAQITFVQASSSQQTIIEGFGETTNTASYVTNTGFGKITKLIYHQIIHDSLTPYLSNNPKDHLYIRRRNTATSNTPLAAFSQKYDTYPEGQLTNLGNGYREYSIALEGIYLDREDGEFNPGDRIQINAGYFRFPTSCIDDMLQKQWITYECIGGGSTCNIAVDTLARVYRVSAGVPIVSGLNSLIDAWDGCAEKNGSFTFKNTGVLDTARPEFSVAYDVDLGLALGGKMYIGNLTLGGATVATTPTTPGAVSSISWDLKDKNTVDFDGPGGIDDLDGDGYYDDLKPGDSINVTFTYTLDCDLVCGADLHYDIKSTSSFTDYCGTLNGTGSSNIYEFGFKQSSPVEQVTPLPNYGTMSGGQVETRQASFTFNYQGINLNTGSAQAKLRINYSKTMTIKEPIVFMGTTIPLSSFTQIGAGALDTTGYNQTTDVDSALEYTLTAAQITALLDNSADDLSYWVSHISCDSFQSQNNLDGFQLLFQINNSPCPAPNTAPPCELDLACNKAFAYQVIEGCGVKPCYRINDSISRYSLVGHTDENQTTPVVPTGAGASKFYEGDTLTFLRTAQLGSDYPVMEPIGGTPSATNDFYSYFSFSYNKDPNKSIYEMTEPAYEFVPTISRLRVRDTSTNTILYDLPIEIEDWYTIGGFIVDRVRGPNDPVEYYSNIADAPLYQPAPDINSVPGKGLGDYRCFTDSWTIDAASCPYTDLRVRVPNSTLHTMMENDAGDRLSEIRYLYFGDLLARNGANFDPGYSKYVFEIDTKWRVNPDYDHQNVASLRERGGVRREGNELTPAPSGTRMAPCNIGGQAVATAVTSELAVNGGGATYQAACNLTICNNIDFNSPVGDFFPGEVRVPFKMDSIVVEMPTEYNLTAAPTFSGTAGGPANSITGSATTGHIVFTNNTANSGTSYMDFPRISDTNGGQLVWSVCYPISNVGTDNFITESYKVPVRYYARSENGDPIILIDTFNITESTPVITLAPLGGAVQINDGGACADSYMDVLVSNNTIYAAEKVFIAAESNPNVTVVQIEDAEGEMPADPIDPGDISTYGTNNFYAELGGMSAGGRRVVRVYFNTTSCADSLKLFSNFGCNYPLSKQPEYPSPTLDSAYIIFNSVSPGMMSGPIDGNKSITNLCDVQTLEIEIRNVKNPNLTNILAGIKLPANAVYVASSAEIAYPTDDYVTATGVTVTGTDSLTIDISADTDLATACGLNGADETEFLTGLNANNSSPANVVRIKFDVDFTACPTVGITSDAVYYDVSGQNYCGTEVTSKGVFNMIYDGTVLPNTFSCKPADDAALFVCSDSGATAQIKDSMWVVNESGPTTAAGTTMEIVIAHDTTSFDIANFTVDAPWSQPVVTTTPEGRPLLSFTMLTGIASGDSAMLVLNYDLTPKKSNVCEQADFPCAALSHSVTFYSEILVECPAKGLNCTSLGQVARGTAYVPKSLTCCKQGLGDRVWLDTDEDGIQDPNEVGVAGVTVDLYDNGPDGLPNTADDELIGSTVTDAYGNYYFDDLPMGDYNLGFTPPANYTFTQQVGAGDNSDNTNSDVEDMAGSPNFGRTGTFTLTAGEQDSTIDAGLILPQPDPTASVGNFVWLDTDGDGLQDPGESGIAGVTVQLLDSAGNVVATTVTDGNGEYLFDNVTPGDYSVQFTPPVGVTPTQSLGGVASATNSDMDPNTMTTPTFTVNAGDSIRYVDAGFTLQDSTKASLGDKVWYDANNDGIQDPDEAGVPGVTVYLYDSTGTNILDSTVTDAFGNYIFNDLTPSTYVVGFDPSTLPTGFVFSPQNASGSDSTNNSDANTTTGKTDPITLAPGEKNMTVDAGIDNPALTNSIGDYVWNDVNKDGIQDPGEPAMAGITVKLYDSAGNVIATTVTDKDGFYLFPELPNGDYSVGFSNLPTGYGFSTAGAGSDSTLDSDADPVTGLTQTVSLTGNTNIRDLDAGISNTGSNSATASLGDRVWVDRDGDGKQDVSETGVAGVTVYLYAADGTTVLDSTVTDGLGNYIFTDLPPGGYVVGFDLNTLPAGFTPTIQDVNGATGNANDGTDGDDSDADLLTGKTAVVNLNAGDDNLGIDLGIVPPANTASLGNRVWYDDDKDGGQVPGTDVGVAGVIVELLDSVGNVIATTVTNSDGYYYFHGLAPGTYSTRFSDLPDGYEFTEEDAAGTTNGIDSDADPETGETRQVTLSAGQSYNALDAGIFSDTKAALGDYVWFDTDGDGIQDPDELPIPGVLVTLYDSVGNPVATAVTDADGKYWFPNLDPGTYTVGFTNLPEGTTFTTQETTPGSNGSDVDPSTGRTGPIVLNAGDVNQDVDAGVTTEETAGLGNYVWNDLDEDGIQDPGEPGVAGVLVTLYGSDGTTVIATALTDGEGAYSFTDLPPGDYIVGFSNFPLGMTPTQTVGSLNDGDNSDMNTVTHKTSLISLTAGEYNPNVDAGLYIGFPLSADGFRATYANLQGDRSCSVNWLTIKEENTKTFFIERSINGTDFIAVGQTAAGANTNTQTDYKFVDDIKSVADADKIYYRIKLVDLDNQFAYSNTISVQTFDKENVVVYPSPFENELNITYSADEAGFIDIHLTDVTGKTIRTFSFDILDGTNRIQLTDLEHLAIGQYFLKFVNGDTKQQFIIKIQKK